MISFRSILGWFDYELTDRMTDYELRKPRAGQRLAEAVAENDEDMRQARAFRKITRAARKEGRRKHGKP